MARILLGLELKSKLIVALLAVVILILPVDTAEPFEITYQASVLKEYQVPIQKEKTEIVISRKFELSKQEHGYRGWVSWRPRDQNEWATGFFTSNDTLQEFSIIDNLNFIDSLKNTTWGTIKGASHIISDNFTFKPQKIDTYYFDFYDFHEAKIISFELTSHWYEAEYETHYKTENETYYKTEYKTIKKPLYEVFLSRLK